jgi:putative mRNA 3-end processing factor
VVNVEYLQGLHVVDSALWLDAPRRADLCFLSHAHPGRPPGRARKVLTSEVTAKLLGRSLDPSTTLVCPFQRRFTFGNLDLWLHPAGQLPGSAQLEATREGERLVYAGPVRLSPGGLGEPGRILPCDLLLLSAELGAAQHRFPPRAEVAEQLVAWARGELGRGRRPSLFVPELGVAQEVGAALARAGLQLRGHRRVRSAFRALAEAAALELPGVASPGGRPGPDEVWLLPLPARAPVSSPGLPGEATAMAGEPAVEPGAARRWGVERAFAWTCRADREELVRYAAHSGARRVVLFHGAAEELAAAMRTQGLPATALATPSQLELFPEAAPGAAS